jgi:hypothetical protein
MPEYFPPEMDIFMTIFDNQGNLQGAVVRMTFLKVILKNTTNSKNNARVYSHFVYVGFEEINLECEAKLGENWKINPEQYPFALKQLINYTVNNTSFLPSLSQNLISNFELKLKDDNFKRWYFYFSDTAGPSVSEGINDVVKKIFSGQIGIVSDENVDVSESIVKVAQKLYMDSPKLSEIFTQQTGVDIRSYAFESTFLLRIKYIGDKSRCTDSLFLNRNKYAECMQITGDENAYFTALVNGASTIYSPPSKFALYFAPYFTYGDVENEGKFLMNLPIYKETLLKGESPTEFKISSSSSRKKTNNTELAIPFESSLVKERGALASGVDVRSKANDIIKDANTIVNVAYAYAQDKSRTMEETSQLEDLSKKKKQQKDIKKALEGYVSDYNDLAKSYDELKETVDRIFIREIERNGNELTYVYYNKIIEQLKNIFTDNEFIIEPVVISKEDFERIKQEIIEFIEKALQSMKTMSSQPYSKVSPPQMLDINSEPVVDKKGNVLLPGSAYDDLKKNIPVYEKILNSLKQIEDVEDFYGVLKELNEFYNNKILSMSSSTKKVIFWDENIDKNINFIFSLSDIMNHILPNIKTAKNKFASQTNKYDKFKDIINKILEELPEFSRKKSPTSAPTKLAPKLVADETRAESAPAVLQTAKEEVSEIKMPTELEAPSSSVVKAKTKIGRQSLDDTLGDDTLGGGPNEESYRKNQIYILKCFSDLIKTNNSEHEGLITPDKTNFNYNSIDNIDKYCISILMLQTYYSLNSFQPKLKSLQDVTDEIATLNEDKSTLQDAINIRNYYSQIIDTFVDIEYLQPDAIDYIIGLNNIDIIEGDNIIYDMKKWCDINFYLIEYIYNNLKLINSVTNKFIDNIDAINFGIITQIFDITCNVDLKIMSGYYELSKLKNEIDSFEDFTPEEKETYKKQISIVESYEYLCLFLVKYCNQLFIRMTKNKLNYSTNGLLYSYDIINNKLSEQGLTELLSKFDSIKINIGNSDKVESSLLSFNDSGNLKSDLESISNILLELSSVSEIEEVPLKDMGKGLPENFSLNLNLRRQRQGPIKMSSLLRRPRDLLGAGTCKNKKAINARKTRNNKIKNKKGSIKKRDNKIKRNTRRR